MENEKRLRVLCMHGYMTNSTIMKMQMRDWIRQFNQLAVFEYINGPYERSAAEVIDPRIKRIAQTGESSYSWMSFSSSQYEKDTLKDLKYLIDILDNQGPYDGVIGFSQGGAMLNTLLQFIQEKKVATKYEIKFAVIINSPFQSYPTCQISIPSIQFACKEDEFYDRQVVLSTFYKNPIIIEHSFGHRIPPLTPRDALQIKGLFLKFKPSFIPTKNISESQQTIQNKHDSPSNSQRLLTKDVIQQESNQSILTKQKRQPTELTPKL